MLLLFEHRGIAMPYSKKASAHPEPLPIRQSTGSSQPPSALNCTQFQSYHRQRIVPDNTELSEERMKDWAGTHFIYYFPLLFIALWIDSSNHHPSAPGLIPSHNLYLYRHTPLNHPPPYQMSIRTSRLS